MPIRSIQYLEKKETIIDLVSDRKKTVSYVPIKKRTKKDKNRMRKHGNNIKHHRKHRQQNQIIVDADCTKT